MFRLTCLRQIYAKPFSIGHLRSTVIGDSIAKIYEKLGLSANQNQSLGRLG